MLRKIKVLIIINMMLLVFLLGLNLRLNSANAQSNGDSLTIPINFSMLEFGERNGTNENVGSIDIEIPSSSWNLTDIQLNFTDIKLEREIITIEDQQYGVYGHIYKKNPSLKRYGLGVQINLTEATIIHGVYMYGYKTSETTELINVQLRGYDNLNNKPNSTIYSSVNFNVSLIPGWYLQNFSNPISLSTGNYFLVLNGTNIISDSTHYYWAYNDIDPTNPNLHSSEYISQWLDGAQNSPYLYTLIQKVNRSYSPEEINMTARLNGGDYQISNSILPGSGNLNISGINYSPSEDFIKIPIESNLSINFLFNVSYHIKLIKNLNSNGNINIQENRDNHWTVNPTFIRNFSNYSIKFNYPESWIGIRVNRSGIDITSQILINNLDHFIFIPNNTILTGADWLISANSSKISFTLDVDRTEFLAGQELKFFISEPLLNGNYTFILNDPFHYKIYTSNKSITAESNWFTYIIPSSALDGDYKAFVYWFNGTDAGIVTQVFTVILPIKPFVIDWTLVIGIVVIAGLGSAVTASSIILAKKNKRKKLATKEKTINKFMDILNLNYLIVIEKKSSLSVYDQAFTGKKFDATLISGFLEAIRTFGFDITGSEERSQTVKLEYQNSKILMSDFKHFRLIFIMKNLPSSQFYEVIDDLSLEIEEKYGMYLKEFRGNLQPFEGIENLLKRHLGTAFLYPLKLVGIGKMKITPTEKFLINKTIGIMKQTRLEYFYVTQLIKEITFDSKEIEALYSLITKRVFNPFS